MSDYSTLIIAAVTFIIGILAGVALMVFSMERKKDRDNSRCRDLLNDIDNLHRVMKWLEKELERLMGEGQYKFFKNLWKMIREKDKEIANLKISFGNLELTNRHLGDEIASLEEANKIKYDAGFVNGKLHFIKELKEGVYNNTIPEPDHPVPGRIITGIEMIMESAVIEHKNMSELMPA